MEISAAWPLSLREFFIRKDEIAGVWIEFALMMATTFTHSAAGRARSDNEGETLPASIATRLSEVRRRRLERMRVISRSVMTCY